MLTFLKKNLLLLACLSYLSVSAQSIQILDSGKNVSMRGLSVVNDKVIWCSGSYGSVARSIDGGKSFEWLKVAGYGQRDFRDIEAFDANTAVIMAISEPAILLKTTDGGKSWQRVLEDTRKGMFLDAMNFDRKGRGYVIGDPIGGKVYLAQTNDWGNTWQRVQAVYAAEQGESFFASSGSNIMSTRDKNPGYLFVSGGMVSQLYYRHQRYPLALMKGKESTGANSVAVRGNKAIVVGGDFAQDKRKDSNCVLIELGGNHPGFSTAQTAPLGYRSSVIFYSKKIVVCCGTSGVDISTDGGKNWKNISTQSFHVVQKAKKGKAIFLSGSKGKIARLVL